MALRPMRNHQNVRKQTRAVVEAIRCDAARVLVAWRHALPVCLVFVSTAVAEAQSVSAPATASLLEGKAAYGDWRSDAPGVRRHIRASDLPTPYSTPSIANSVSVVGRPAKAKS
jgi:hypothetical protein